MNQSQNTATEQDYILFAEITQLRAENPGYQAIDCFDGMVVSWSIGTSPDAELVNGMLNAAIETVANNADQPIVHPEREQRLKPFHKFSPARSSGF